MKLMRCASILMVTGLVSAPAVTAEFKMKRTPSGKPDLTGTYDGATLTPLERPERFGDKQFMSKEEADRITREAAEQRTAANAASDPDRGAPVHGGGAVKTGGGGGTGGYNSFWVDPGDDILDIDGQIRTSIIYDPPNGRQPEMTPEGRRKRSENFTSFTYVNDGTASWLDHDGPGPFDGPENVALAERCLLGFSAGPPMLPGLYNSFKRIVQTETHVMILMEMVHDARIIKLEGAHHDGTVRDWLGDSVGRWEGDTLVVETKNFREFTGLYGGDENLHLVERFTLTKDGHMLYDFTVNDPTAWTAPWSGEYVWKREGEGSEKVYEYACHEGNYAMGNILRGARLLEKEELERRAATDDR